ncbi:MAG: hypothetical protein KGL35_29345 [Bradyrhizobium sp.]|uniref:hypothetical protein n=1 Tax=Bradyrhizobium sp. TaxID=376 RepID=UPI001C2A06EB|nr:hypothetical protein [Bradyrhizobium sp.]MBU6464401.1 hypothetical protein [Pseudomonadota bacterium]MDE2069436.1 hypothetical protein [Bradyrhizobium sp.]MDE2472719.1 hypothetical protein [Bradyrhizobium sp.]
MRRIGIGQGIILAFLLALLIGTGIFAISAWTSTGNVVISEQGWLAIGLGTFFSLIIGCSLVALTFYSSRHGYDDAVDEFRDSRSREQAKWMAERENKSLGPRRDP